MLALMAAEACGSSFEAALPAACAIEMVHTYSLIHDDLPAMDDDDLRRGRPTTHIAFDEATAILAGDALQTFAFQLLLERETSPHADRRVDAALLLARATGANGMVGGQMIDILAETQSEPMGAEAIRVMQSMKTGALLAASAEIGAVLGGASGDERRRIAAYGAALGAAFQIADDLLDETGDEAEAGKRLRKDAEAGKATLPSILGTQVAREEAAAKVAAAEAAMQPFGDAADSLRHAARFSLERRR